MRGAKEGGGKRQEEIGPPKEGECKEEESIFLISAGVVGVFNVKKKNKK